MSKCGDLTKTLIVFVWLVLHGKVFNPTRNHDTHTCLNNINDKGLVTNYREGRGYKTGWGGGAREVLPLQKGEAEKVWAMLKGGHKKFRGSFYAVAWSFIHIVGGGGREQFPVFKRGGVKTFTLSWGGGGAQKVSDPQFSHFVAPPSP